MPLIAKHDIIYNMNDNVFFNRLRYLRQKSKLTQKELANALNTTQNTISNWESGRQEPSREKLIAISKIFNIQVEYLFGTDSKTVKRLEQIKPQIITQTLENGSDYSKHSLNNALSSYNAAKINYEKNKTKDSEIDLIMSEIELNRVLFSLAEDELLYIEPDTIY